jgi:hypothetical protein
MPNLSKKALQRMSMQVSDPYNYNLIKKYLINRKLR